MLPGSGAQRPPARPPVAAGSSPAERGGSRIPRPAVPLRRADRPLRRRALVADPEIALRARILAGPRSLRVPAGRWPPAGLGLGGCCCGRAHAAAVAGYAALARENTSAAAPAPGSPAPAGPGRRRSRRPPAAARTPPPTARCPGPGGRAAAASAAGVGRAAGSLARHRETISRSAGGTRSSDGLGRAPPGTAPRRRSRCRTAPPPPPRTRSRSPARTCRWPGPAWPSACSGDM